LEKVIWKSQKFKKPVFSILLILLVSILVFSSSFFIEFVLEKAPCRLCLWQRWIFFAIAVFSLSAFIFKRSKTLKILLLGIVSIGFFVSVYHSLVTLDFIPDKCPTENAFSSRADFMLSLSKSSGCKSSTSFLHIPIPIWSAMVFCFLLLTSFISTKTENSP
jgi:disulfide bond formation protein DsbB